MPRNINVERVQHAIIDFLYEHGPSNFNAVLREMRRRSVVSDPSCLAKILNGLVEEGRLRVEERPWRGMPLKIYSLSDQQMRLVQFTRIIMEPMDAKEALKSLIKLIERNELKPLDFGPVRFVDRKTLTNIMEGEIKPEDKYEIKTAEKLRIIFNAIYAVHECLGKLIPGLKLMGANPYIKVERTKRGVTISVKQEEKR